MFCISGLKHRQRQRNNHFVIYILKYFLDAVCMKYVVYIYKTSNCNNEWKIILQHRLRSLVMYYKDSQITFIWCFMTCQVWHNILWLRSWLQSSKHSPNCKPLNYGLEFSCVNDSSFRQMHLIEGLVRSRMKGRP